jgi:V/A-type H+-transporting ATPase subunit D
MAIKFQFNKTSLNDLNKQLKIRTNALPTLKNKESALRFEVKRAKYRSDELANRLESVLRSYQHICGLWNEFRPDLIKVKDVNLETVKVAGVKTPSLKEIIFEETPFNFSLIHFGTAKESIS